MYLPTSHGPGHTGDMQKPGGLGGEWQADPARIQPLPPCFCGLCSWGTSCWLGPSFPGRNLGKGAAATLPAIKTSDPVLTTEEKPPFSPSGCVRGPGGGATIITPHPSLSFWPQLRLARKGPSHRACSHGLLASWAKLLTSAPGPTSAKSDRMSGGRQQRGYFWWLLSGCCSLGLLLSQFSLQQGRGGIAASRFILAPLLFRPPAHKCPEPSPRPGLPRHCL